MKIKRFVDKDSRGAMAQVRSTLGPEAVILSNKRIGNQVEMVAAIDLDHIAELAQGNAADSPQSPPNLSLVNAQPTLSGLQQELGHLRTLVERRMESLGAAAADDPLSGQLRDRLLDFGLPTEAVTRLLASLPETQNVDDGWALAMDTLREQLPVLAQDSLIDAGGRIAVQGTSGAGKTTTLAKLAARFVLRHGKEHIALVSMDCYRVGGQEQLQAFAQYLEVPLFIATDAKELRMALDQLQHKRMVLLDMPGISQRDEAAVNAQAEMLRGSGYDIQTCLVLPATSSVRVQEETLTAFGGERCAGVVVSRQDEAAELGGTVHALIRHQQPLAYVGTGQKVPQDLVPAGADTFIHAELTDETQKSASLSQTLQDSLSAGATRVRT